MFGCAGVLVPAAAATAPLAPQTAPLEPPPRRPGLQVASPRRASARCRRHIVYHFAAIVYRLSFRHHHRDFRCHHLALGRIVLVYRIVIALLLFSFLFCSHFSFQASLCGCAGVSAGMAQCVRIPTPHGRLWAANFSAVSGPRASLPPGTDLLINLTKQDTPGFILRSQGSRDNCFCALISIVCLEAFTSHGDIRS